MEILHPDSLKINWVSYFKTARVVSLILSVLGLLSMIYPGFNYGIDFRGGIQARVDFKDNSINENNLRNLLGGKLKNLEIIKNLDKDHKTQNEYSLIAQSEDKNEAQRILKETLNAKYGAEGSAWTVSSFDAIGPRVSANLRQTALLSLLYTCFLVALYIYWRFDIRYAPGALACIFHDLLVVVGFIIVSHMEFTTTLVAALLTLAGYSINDTVVVFDRIREVEQKFAGKDKKWVINEAINSTLSRTLLISATTLTSCLVLYFAGGIVLRDFALVLFVGVVVGTYSSAFVAAPLYLWAHNRFEAQHKAKSLKA